MAPFIERETGEILRPGTKIDLVGKGPRGEGSVEILDGSRALAKPTGGSHLYVGETDRHGRFTDGVRRIEMETSIRRMSVGTSSRMAKVVWRGRIAEMLRRCLRLKI